MTSSVYVCMHASLRMCVRVCLLGSARLRVHVFDCACFSMSVFASLAPAITFPLAHAMHMQMVAGAPSPRNYRPATASEKAALLWRINIRAAAAAMVLIDSGEEGA